MENLAAELVDRPHRLDHIALCESEHRVAYGELADQVRRVATVLRGAGVAAGDRVCVFASDTIESATAFLGVIYAGAVAVPVGELGNEQDLRDVLLDSGASCLLVDEWLVPVVDFAREELQNLRNVFVLGKAESDETCLRQQCERAHPGPPANVGPDAIAFIQYSFGASKESTDASHRRRACGVPHTHRTPLQVFENLAGSPLGLLETDRVLSLARFATGFGLGNGLIFPLAAGATAILLPEQPTSEHVFAAIEREDPTVMFATPSVYGQLARDAIAESIDTPLGRLRLCVSGLEDMPPVVVDRVKYVLGVEATIGYGLTEVFQLVIAGASKTGRPGACGTAMEGFELRIVDDDEGVLGADEIGTLQIKGPSIARGYWAQEVEPGDGWFRTPDRFMTDEEGHYYHCGRIDQLFKVGGKWVSPQEVEDVLLRAEAVWECAVIGADDEDGFVKPMAFVVANVGFEVGHSLEEQLRQYVKDQLAPFKYPRWIEFVESLPRGPHGGVLRYKLRELMLSSQRPRRAETAAPE